MGNMEKFDMFRQAALDSGYQPGEVDAFLSTVKVANPTPEVQSYDGTGKTFEQMMAETGQQSTLDKMTNGATTAPTPLTQVTPKASFSPTPAAPAVRQAASQQNIQPLKIDRSKFVDSIPAITQPFGNRHSVEKFSGGVNLGTDFRAGVGTPLAVPQGNWIAEKVVTGGRPGDRSFNSGSGNMVTIKNVDTGETIGFEHLGDVGVQPGKPLQPGTVLGTVGLTGNLTGAHASIPYKDANGNYKDIAKSPYVQGIFTPQEQAAQPMVSQTPDMSANPAQSDPGEILSLVPEPQREAAKTAIPALTQALKEQGISDPKAISYAIATAGGESGFTPKDEVMAQRGINAHNDRIADFQDNYDGGKAYRGRGYIQLTHKSNYKKYGDMIGVDLVSKPELANDPVVAAKILAAYMKESGAADAASKGDYLTARKRVNGSGALNADEIARQAQSYQGYIR